MNVIMRWNDCSADNDITGAVAVATANNQQQSYVCLPIVGNVPSKNSFLTIAISIDICDSEEYLCR
jgi:hypothetical protein